MEGNGIKIGLIVSGVIAVALSLGMAFEQMGFIGGEEGISGDGTIWLKCTSPDCNAAFSLTREEFQKEVGNNPIMMSVMPGQVQMFKCQKCEQKTAVVAEKCTQCGEVFIANYGMPSVSGQAADYPDRCPKCGHSAMEESEKK